MRIRDEILSYSPWNDQESADRLEILRWLDRGDDLFSRNNLSAHFTASVWIVNPSHTNAFMGYHNIYQSWAWLGGHADGQVDLLAVAVREAQEESGLTGIRPVLSTPFSLEILSVAGHEKAGMYVPSHLHLNVTYLLEADPVDPIRSRPDEHSMVAWFSLEDAVSASTEPWFQMRIYSKLNSKLMSLYGGHC